MRRSTYIIFMRVVISSFLFVMLAFWGWGCAMSVSKNLTLNDPANLDILTLPIREDAAGLLILDDVIVNGRALSFLIDTGATQSAVFGGDFSVATKTTQPASDVFIHGIMQAGVQKKTMTADIQLGQRTFRDLPLIVLDERPRRIGLRDGVSGLIGMDILRQYHLHVMQEQSMMRLIPLSLGYNLPRSWDQVKLRDNPFKAQRYDLHFVKMEINDQAVFALIDTGAELSIMNWQGADFKSVKRYRRKLREQWEMMGAIGTFFPSVRLDIEQLRAGEKSWYDEAILVMDLPGLEILGIENKPFMIGWANLFNRGSYLIDFQNDVLAFSPSKRPTPRSDPFYDLEFGEGRLE